MRSSIVIVALLIFASGLTMYAQVPQTMSYQGLLTTPIGTPLPDGAYNFQFDLYDSLTGGSSQWTESQTGDTVRRGTFSVILGVTTPITIPFTKTLYLQVRVTGGPAGPPYPLAFSPRSVLTSAPYAFHSKFADSVAGGLSGQFLSLAGGQMTGAITNTGDPPITMGKGNFGTGNVNPGTFASVAGSNNRARGQYSVVSGGGGAAPGDSNSASGDYSTVGGGTQNGAGGYIATVSGGDWNHASGYNATVSGGNANIASGSFSIVGGGQENKARGQSSVVGGGGSLWGADSNSALGDYSTIAGGRGNIAGDSEATVSGGSYNNASGIYSAVGGGKFNSARGQFSVISGGGGATPVDSNTASGDYSTVSGGLQNNASGLHATIGGGFGNHASGTFYGSSTVGGGGFNIANRDYATVGGGYSDSATGASSTVPGGYSNNAAGDYSFASGYRAKANHNWTFVWAGLGSGDFASTNANQFLIRASGGVGIDTNNPGGAALAVNGATQLGNGAPLIMMKKLTGTTSNLDGGTVSIAHGLDQMKVLSIEVLVDWGNNGSYVPPLYPVAGAEFYWASGGSNINITNVAGNDATILSKPIKILIVYEQ